MIKALQIITPLTRRENTTLQHALIPLVRMKKDILGGPEDESCKHGECSKKGSEPRPEESPGPAPLAPLHHDPLHLLLPPAAGGLLLLPRLLQSMPDVGAEDT